jgi:hypothetical protein
MTGPWIAVVVAQWLALALLAVILLGFVRRHAAVLERAERYISNERSLEITGLEAGQRPESFDAVDHDGRMITVSGSAGPAIFLFLSGGCAPCRDIARELTGLASTSITMRIVVVVDKHGSWAPSDAPGISVLAQVGDSASAAFRSNATPQAFAVDSAGVVQASIIPGSIRDLEELERAVTEEEIRAVTKEEITVH